MAKFVGRIADVGIAKEATRGTAESSVDFWLPKLSFTLDDKIEQAIDESSIGIIEDSADARVVGQMAEGEIEGNIYDRSFGLLLLNALGAVNTTGPAQTTVYTHAFSVGQSAQHPSLTLFLDDPNQDYTFALGMLDSLELDVALGAFAKFTAGFRSKRGATATLSPSYVAENHFLPQHGSVRLATNLAGLGAASAIDVRNVKLSIAKNIEDDRRIGSLDQADILNKQFAVEGTVELVFNDNTFKTDMLGDVAKAMRIRLTNTDVTIGSSLNPQLTIDLAKVKFTSFEKSYGNDDIVTAVASFKAFYSVADSSMITMELINTVSTY